MGSGSVRRSSDKQNTKACAAESSAAHQAKNKRLAARVCPLVWLSCISTRLFLLNKEKKLESKQKEKEKKEKTE